MIEMLPFDMQSLRSAYASGAHPSIIVREVFRRISEVDDPGIFIALRDKDDILREVDGFGAFEADDKPLWGIPFCIKDNIDAAGMATTAGCPAFAYQAGTDAAAVELLRDAGAILIGKTNLDQFATGLVGVRTPFPVPRNAINPTLVPGGSSSGSAVAVANGIVTFSLGTDTAGSGRVPAALNNIVGLKPTLGTISSRGVVPACRTLDTISVFALNVDDAFEVTRTVAGYDAADPYSRQIALPAMAEVPTIFNVGVPSKHTREFFGDRLQADAFDNALQVVSECGGQIVELDFNPFFDTAALLYTGSWVAERYTVIADLLGRDAEAVHPTTRKVIEAARSYSAADAFQDQYRLATLKRQIAPMLAGVDMLCVPTVPTIARLSDVEADPVGPNSRLGTYTNFVNLIDLCGISVPTPPRADGLSGSLTLLAGAGRDAQISAVARMVHQRSGVTAGATGWHVSKSATTSKSVGPDEIELAVVGAHMSGLPLNNEITRLGGRFLRKTRTAAEYRLYALAGGPPARPGLVRASNGCSIAVETWAIPKVRFGEFISGIPQPLGIGTVTLDTNEQVKGFICEAAGLEGAQDVSPHGGWRNYLGAQVAPTPTQ